MKPRIEVDQVTRDLSLKAGEDVTRCIYRSMALADGIENALRVAILGGISPAVAVVVATLERMYPDLPVEKMMAALNEMLISASAEVIADRRVRGGAARPVRVR